MKSKLFTLFIILMVLCPSLISPVIATGSKEVTVEKTTKLEIESASKEKVTVNEFTSTASGDSKVKSKDISLKTEKLDKSLKISSTTKTKSKSVDSHDILVPVADIQNFNGHSVRITHFTDGGIQDNEYIQKVTVQDGYVLIPEVEFSSIIVDGFTGSKSEVSYNVNVTDYEFEVTENGSLTITLDGVPDGVEIDENDSSTYPNNPFLVMPMHNATNIVGNITPSFNNVVFNGSAIFDGTSSYIEFENSTSLNIDDSITFKISFNYVANGNIQRVFNKGDVDSGAPQQGYELDISSSNILMFRTNNGTFTYTYVIDTLVNNTDYDIIFRKNSTRTECIINGITHTSSHNSIGSYTNNYNLVIGARSSKTSHFFNSYINLIDLYDNYVSDGDFKTLETGYSGTSAKLGENGEWQPVINGTVTFDNVVAGETVYLLSADESVIATTLTKEYSYTQDYTLIEESETTDYVTVQINATAGANMSESQLVYDVTSLNFTHNMSISSNNPNVTGTYHNGTVTLDTGLLNFGDSFNYTLTFDKLTSFTFWANWISKTSTKAVVEYNSTNSNVENDFYLENMSASSTFDFKYSNGTILANATSDSNGYLKFDDVRPMVNGTYTIETQAEKFPVPTFVAVTSGFVAVVFAIASFINQRRKRW